MANPASTKEPLSSASNDSKLGNNNNLRTLGKRLSKRQSKELVIALCGPIGSGVHNVRNQLQQVLKDEGYEVHDIRVSTLIKKFYEKTQEENQIDTSTATRRYTTLMDAGDSLRANHGESICGALAAYEIAHIRDRHNRNTEQSEDDENASGLIKRAFIIDQLKHPEEVKFLKEIYSGIFYLVGVLCDESRREISLTADGMDRKEAQALILRDRQNNESHGQQLEKTLSDADFFINNSDPNSSSVAALFSRFLKLLHGGRGVTPTQQETGMYSAYSASMQSACMSRQVGAAILDSQGMILSTGRNDVPKFGGGLYSEDDNVAPNSKDYRCVHRDQQCHNDLHKQILKEKIQQILDEELAGYPELKVDDIAEKIQTKTPIKSLIEYSRAIHAEMDALISLVRNGKSISTGTTLYTTTYPCHNCARHIIASGIEKVIFIEPYEKSLALKLHDDALCHTDSKDKVHLIPFQGIAPSRYQVFFSNTSAEKDKRGRLIHTDREDQMQVDKEFVDSYIGRELKVAGEVVGFFGDEAPDFLID